MDTPQAISDLGWYFGTLSFVMGAIVGSFLNVCIYRVPAKRSISRPGSHCYQCGTAVRWFDNVPILSYLILLGRCRQCGTRFSSRYMWVEMLTAALFLALFLKFGATWALPFHCVVVALLIFGTFTDIDHYIIPDSVTLGGLGFALVAAGLLGFHGIIGLEYLLARDIYGQFELYTSAEQALPPRWVPFVWALASAGFGWFLLAGVGALGKLLFRKEAMGGGDVKLFAFLGAYLGAVNCVLILFLSAMVGSVLGLSLLLAHRLVGRTSEELIELRPAPTVVSPPPDPDSAAEEAAEHAESGPLVLKVVRNTASQLHHFPYGPYIAVAALVVLFLHREINRHTRELLMLPDEPAITAPHPFAAQAPPVPNTLIRRQGE